MATTARIAPGDLRGLDQLRVDALALPLFQAVKQPTSIAGFADWRLSGRIGRLVKNGRFRGEVGESLLMPSLGRIGPARIFLFGLGVKETLKPSEAADRLHAMIRALIDARARVVAAGIPESSNGSLVRGWLEAAADEKERFDEIVLLDGDGSVARLDGELARAARKRGLTWSG